MEIEEFVIRPGRNFTEEQLDNKLERVRENRRRTSDERGKQVSYKLELKRRGTERRRR